MKPWIISCLLMIPIVTVSQHLTRYEVYDFEEGEVFQTELAIGTNLNAGPIEYRTDSIQKILYRSDDSLVFETRFTRFFRMPNWPPDEYSTPVTGTLIISLGTLSDTTFHQHGGCQKISDSLYYSPAYCQRRVSAYSAGKEEPACQYKSLYIEGCGGPYVTQFSVDTTTRITYFSNHRLVYYSKKGENCGNFISEAKDILAEESVVIFPNPFNDHFLCKNLPLNTEIRVFDLKGKTVLHDVFREESVDTRHLIPGEYLILLTAENGFYKMLTATKVN
jgi:hypothetical protein